MCIYVINVIAEYFYNNREIKIEDRLKLIPFHLRAISSEKLIETWEKYSGIPMNLESIIVSYISFVEIR